jgi:hypothetical protein
MSRSHQKLTPRKTLFMPMQQEMSGPNPKTTLEAKGSGEPFTQDRLIHQ